MTAPFKIVEPLAVNDTIITASNVEEDFLYPEYVPATNYTKGLRVKYTPAHAVFEAVHENTNQGHTPGEVGSEAYWLRVSATNKYKMFDTSPSTSTIANGTSFYYSFKFYSFVTTIALLKMVGVTNVNVTIVTALGVELYNQTHATSSVPVIGGSWWDFFFGQRTFPTQLVLTDLPFDPTATITVTVTGSAGCSVGVAVFGRTLEFGLGASYGSEVGFTDYSRKEVNSFGDTILAERPYSDRANFEVEVSKAETDNALNYLKALRATPFLAVGTDEYDSTTLYCYVQDARVSFSYPTYNVLTVELTGMT